MNLTPEEELDLYKTLDELYVAAAGLRGLVGYLTPDEEEDLKKAMGDAIAWQNKLIKEGTPC